MFEELMQLAPEDKLPALIEDMLNFKGKTVVLSEIERWADLARTAHAADMGLDIEGQPWASYVAGLDGDSKLETAARNFAQTVGATPREANQFIEVLYAAADVVDGADVAQVEAELIDTIEEVEGSDELLPYAHLDDVTRAERLAYDAKMREPDPARPEPAHIEETE